MDVHGNRGKCAQPCRLPYTLYQCDSSIPLNLNNDLSENSIQKLDEGFLLSTKDLCSLEYLPKLIQCGVTSFKVEGRLKSPEYVATVTRIYRKYIDKVQNNDEYIIDETDQKDLMQAFNRGGFSCGHLSNTPNKDLIYSKKQNNMGIPLGKIKKFNASKGYISLELLDSVSIGDSISIDGETGSYRVSELLINNKNTPLADKNSFVTLGRMKGKIKVGSSVYKISSKQLSDLAIKSYENVENIKIPLNAIIDIHLGQPVKIHISCNNSDNSFYNNISFEITSSIIPEKAVNQPISEDRIIKQLSKTSNTPYEFKKITVNLDDDLYIPNIAGINELRRNCIEKLQNIIIEKYCKNEIPSLVKSEENIESNKSTDNSNNRIFSVLLNTVNLDYNYLDLENVQNIYIPFKYFTNAKYISTLKNIANKFDIYIYLPTIMRNNYTTLFRNKINEVLSNFNICGFVLSNIGNITLLDDCKLLNGKYKLIANYTLNIFNNTTSNVLKSLNIDMCTISPELNEDNIINIGNNHKYELICYGNTPIMNMNYCLLGKSNKCYPECRKLCNSNSRFFIKDRMGFNFRIIPDNIDTVTTIYNSKTTFIDTSKIGCTSFRIDILDESIDEINEIVSTIIHGNRLEGKQYTNGNFHREI